MIAVAENEEHLQSMLSTTEETLLNEHANKCEKDMRKFLCVTGAITFGRVYKVTPCDRASGRVRLLGKYHK